jgi:hypothetical protein
MTVLDDIATARAALADVDAQIRQGWNPALEHRRAGVLDQLTAARTTLLGDPAADPDARWPALLLPVRLETRFAWQDPADPKRHTVVRPAVAVATPVLLVRIYPDDVHVDGHDPALTRQEVAWLRDYLKAAAAGRDRKDFVAAWERLVARAGPTRAAWIVRNRPPAKPVVAGKLARPARAALLPDRFTATVDIAGQRFTATGGLVREPLDVTPDPLRSVDGLRWMADFGAALDAGLALAVALPPTAGSAPSVDRLVVTGLHASRDAPASAAAFAGLLDAHHYTTGLAFARPGAATNAIPGERTDRTRDPAIDRVFSVEGDMAPLTHPSMLVDNPPSDGLDAAVLLGLDPLVFGHVAGADGRVRQAGRDVRRLLAAAWLGPVGHLLDPMVPRDELPAVADFYAETLDALGPLPVLTVGDQPYGIWPVSVLSTADPDLSDVERRVLGALGMLRAAIWEPAAAGMPRIGGPPANPTDTLLALLRQDGVAASLAVRPALGPEATAAVVSGYSPQRLKVLRAVRTRIAALLGGLAANPGQPPLSGLLLTEQVPVTAPLVGDAPADYLDQLSLYPPLAVTLLDLSYGAPAPPSAVLHALARLALLESADRACRSLLLDSGVADATMAAGWDRERDDGSTQFYDLAERLNATLPADPLTPLHVQLTGAAPPAGAEPFLAVRDAIRRLALPPGGVAGPPRYPAALLDTVLRAELGGLTTRLDAWFTALATERLRRQRSLPGRNSGLVVGAYGVLLDLVPAQPATAVDPADLPPNPPGEVVRTAANAGYVHAPSVAHAVTAAVLRSAHLAQWRLAPTGAPGRDAFSVDLSSRRVRTALALLDGVREGQPLAALLGYRVERRLRADAPMAVAVVRRAAPLVAGKLTAGGPAEQVAADNVVDALGLLDLVGEPTPTAVDGALRPYQGGVTATDWPSVLTAVAAAITVTRDAVDAVADLLVAEGVFQLVRGNPARAAGSVDAIAAAGSPPPAPAVIDTVRGGTAVVHRAVVALQVGGVPVDDPNGWAATPRATLEPTLEAWARSVLPLPAALVPLRLAALDVVAASPTQLEARLTLAGVSNMDGIDDLAEAAAALRELLSRARPLRPADLTGPGGPAVATADPGGAAGRLAGFAGAMQATRVALDAAIAAKDPAGLRPALLAADLVGTSQPVPTSGEAGDLLAAAATARTELANRLADDDPTQPVEERVRALAAGAAWVLPALTPVAAWPAPPPAGATPSEVQRHVLRCAAVRPDVARLDRVIGVVEALAGTVPTLAVTQQPLDPGERWVALGALPGGTPAPPVKGGRVSVVAYLPAPFPAPVAGPLAGLFVDEWTEVVPDAQATTSIAVHYDAPSSAAPNAALLAVARPGVERWTSAAVVDVVLEALDLARLRAVDSDALAGAGPVLPPLYSRENPTAGSSPVLDVPTLTGPR